MKMLSKVIVVLLLATAMICCEEPNTNTPTPDNNKENNESGGNGENTNEGKNENTEVEEKEDLSFLYLISQSSQTVTYNIDGTTTTSPTTRQEYKYEGYKKIEYALYTDNTIISSSKYAYNGLICTDAQSETTIEYLDNTYLRVKSQTTPTTISEIEYDGKRILNQKYYYNGNLTYECRYEYNGLVATVYAREYDYQTNKLSDWKKNSQITFLDRTYLRIKEQIGYANNYTTYYDTTYDGTKLLKNEYWIDFGEYRVLSIKTEYTYNGLQCSGIQFYFDTSNPQNTSPISKGMITQVFLE